MANSPIIPVSWGELIDKITILEIKSERLTDTKALLNVRKELDLLSRIFSDAALATTSIGDLKTHLRKINEALWFIEDSIREKEKEKHFDREFIELARSVYINNDERARIKREINKCLGSDLIEEKGYSAY
jgi:hypothetical protein